MKSAASMAEKSKRAQTSCRRRHNGQLAGHRGSRCKHSRHEVRHSCSAEGLQKVSVSADAGYRGTCIDEVKVTPHNSAARLAMSFPPSAACKFLDLPPVNLRNLHLHLTKNPFASRPPHLCGVTLINSSGAGWTSPRKSSLMSGKNFRGAGLSNVPLLG